VRAHARALLDAHREEGRIEWVADFAHELPIWVICELIGVPTEDRHLFKEWTIELSLVFSNVLSDDGRTIAENALQSLFGYVRDLIAERRRRPSNDLLSALITSDTEDPLTDIELEALIANLLNGGHETTRSFLSIALVVLTSHRDQLALLRDRPELMPNAVEELLRFESPIVSTMRIARQDVEVGGVSVTTGEMVILSFLGANRDPLQFDQPDRFDVRRADVRPVSFGFGIHHCVGAALARIEGAEALTELVTTCDGLELECEPKWLPFFQVRRIEELPLRFRTLRR
jgi:cytochrome P450